ncbi:acyl-CoA N-acyltransferase [Xylariales sp. PMI_506]|nr:acyl-CoA N-acyltransferase [Xylariales sp. PMI_506]
MANAFKTTRLVFRALENDDNDKQFFHRNLLNDPLYLAHTSTTFQRPRTVQQAEEFVKAVQGSLLGVVICLQSDSGVSTVPIGFLSLQSSEGADGVHHRKAMLGISIVERWRGKGYGSEAIEWALDWAFRVTGLHRVELVTFGFNTDALRLYRKLGFVEEGRQREAMYYNRGWHDFVLFAMLEHEWEKSRGAMQQS